MADLNEIRKLIREDKVALGADVVLKKVEKGEIATVYIAKNCPQAVLTKLERYQKITQFELETLDLSNEELGVACKKPFSIAVIGVVKG